MMKIAPCCTRLATIIGVVSGFLAVAPFAAADDSMAALEARLRNLEAQVEGLVKENAELKNQVKTGLTQADRMVLPAGKETKLTLGGYLQLQSEFGGSPNNRFPTQDRFFLRRARLQVKGAFGSDYDFNLQTDFGNNSITPKSGASGQLADLYVRWKKYPEAIVTVGQFKTPFGYDQLMSDTKVMTIERPLPSDKLTVSRQIGVGLSGDLWDGAVSYATGIYDGNKANVGGNDNDSFMYVGRVSGNVISSGDTKVSLGLNGYTSDDTGSFTGTKTGWGIDAQATWDRFLANVEYLSVESDPVTGATVRADGWSLLGLYTLVPKQWEAVVRYEEYDPSDLVGNDESTLWTFGANYLIKGNDIKLSLNYLVGETAGKTDERLLARLQLVY